MQGKVVNGVLIGKEGCLFLFTPAGSARWST